MSAPNPRPQIPLRYLLDPPPSGWPRDTLSRLLQELRLVVQNVVVGGGMDAIIRVDARDEHCPVIIGPLNDLPQDKVLLLIEEVDRTLRRIRRSP